MDGLAAGMDEEERMGEKLNGEQLIGLKTIQ